MRTGCKVEVSPLGTQNSSLKKGRVEMKKFLHWQFWTTILGIVAYLIWRHHGYGQNQAVYCAVISIIMFTVFAASFFMGDVAFTIALSSRETKRYTRIGTVLFALAALWAAEICDASIYEEFTVFCAAVALSIAAPFEVLLVLVLLIFVFLIAYGVQVYATIAIFCIATIFGFLLTSRNLEHRFRWIFLSSGVQTTILVTVFYLGSKLIK